MKKYELISDDKIFMDGEELYRIRSLVNFGDVKIGDIGGYVEKEANLSHLGNAWVYGNAWVSGNAWVYGDARVSKVTDVFVIHPIGSRNSTLSIFTSKKDILVATGCFLGTLEEFESKVKKTHSEDSVHRKSYLSAIELIKVMFSHKL